MRQRIWKWFLAARFQLFQRHRYRQLVIEQVKGHSFIVLPDVFNPGLFPTGAFLSEQYPMIAKDALVLDMGTGSGIGAVLAAQYAGRVTAVDVNPEAVRCATINALLNHVEDRVEVHQSNLFDALSGKKFDVILFNPPFFKGAPKDLEDHAWRGVDVIARFTACLAQYLTSRGYALVVLSSSGDLPEFVRMCEANRLQVETIAEQDIISEVLKVYRLTVGT